MITRKAAKKAGMILLLIPLALSELYICTWFLPLRWQHAIDQRVARVLPESHEPTYVPHPNLDLEIDQALKSSVPLRIVMYSVTALLLVINSMFIRVVWRFFRRA